jgi:hypothetical protein
MKLHRYLLLLLILAGLPGCQSGFQVNTGDGNFQTLSAQTLVLHRDVRIPPRQSHAYFQKSTGAGIGGEYAPHCELEVRQVLEEAQYVRAGVFEITGIRGETHYVQRPLKNIQLTAAVGFQLLAEDSADWIMQAYHFTLHSDEQPDVLRLICGGAYDFPFYARYPSLEDIQQALGDVASLELR